MPKQDDEYQQFLDKQAEERTTLNVKQAQERKTVHAALLEEQLATRTQLNAKQAEERAAFRTETRGGSATLQRIAEYENGRWVLYRRPWTDSTGWCTLCLSQMAGGKRKRMFTFGWDGKRLSQNGDTKMLASQHDPKVLAWVIKVCSAHYFSVKPSMENMEVE
jgi:hypothetical protein